MAAPGQSQVVAPPTCQTPSSLPPTAERPQSSGLYQCGHCQKRYSRPDHLNRHVQSHTNNRPFACSVCHKAFARTDLLVRHSALHSKGGSDSEPRIRGSRWISHRVSKACVPCAIAKVKCNRNKPCLRCRRKGLECDTGPPQPRDSVVSQQRRLSVDLSDSSGSCRSEMSQEPVISTSVDGMMEGHHLGLLLPQDDLAASMQTCPDPDLTGHGQLEATSSAMGGLAGPNISSSSQNEYLLEEVASDMQFDFASFGNFLNIVVERSFVNKRIALGHQAFQRSLWYSSNHDKADDDERDNHNFAHIEDRLSYNQSMITETFDHDCREKVLLLTVRSCPANNLAALLSTFPSASLMNVLVQRFFSAHIALSDSWIHPATFDPRATCPELLSIIVATGAIGTYASILRQFGYKLNQLARTEIVKKLERTPHPTLELQLLQGLALSLEIDLWSGNHTSLQQMEFFSHMTYTLLRKSHKFRSSSYPMIAPDSTDENVQLKHKWNQWTITESFKRLSTHFCIHDCQKSITLNIRASGAFTEYQMPFPQPKELWLAENAQEWKERYLSIKALLTPNIPDIMGHFPCIVVPRGFLDQTLAIYVTTFFLGSMTVEQNQLATVMKTCLSPERGMQPGVADIRRQELSTAVQSFRSSVQLAGMDSMLVLFGLEHLSMTLLVAIEDIELLAGKEGEAESKRVRPILRQWIDTADSRRAVWHAGQVLRIFRALPQPLHNFHVIVAYHAGLVIFAYSLLKKVKKEDGEELPAPVLGRDDTFFLNGTYGPKVETFITEELWQPAIQGEFRGDSRSVALLRCPRNVMYEVCEIILNKACHCDELAPRLLNSLTELIKDLGNVSRLFEEQPMVYGFP